jgi:23S rRNA pseudouridine1911/1915/1917 synthase
MVRDEMPEALDGERVDRVVALLTGASRSEAIALIAAGVVTVDGRVATKASGRVATGQVVAVDAEVGAALPDLEGDDSVVIELVHVDDSVIVVDKQPGLVVHPGSGQLTGTLVQGLLARFPEIAAVGDPGRPGIVHRLDKGTSGLLVVARTEAAREALVEQLASRSAARRYAALVWGHLASPFGLVDAPIGRSQRDPTRMAVSARGKEARTRYELVTAYDEPAEVSFVRCRLETGRTHQIRVHLTAIGHPVVGDDRYGGRREPLLDVPRPFLHAEHLAFLHPESGDEVAFDSPLPPDLATVLDRLS